MAPFGKGLLAEAAPGFASGVIIELFHQWNVTVAKVTEDVQRDRSLWAEMGLDDRKQLVGLGKQLGNLDFITPELVVESIKDDFPAVASLFLNWPEAGEWLVRQVEQLKKEAIAQRQQ